MDPCRQHIVVIGMMGVGKTTVGRLVAARLEREFWDNDTALAAATGQTAAEVQRTRGQPALHAIEGVLLRHALRRTTPAVFAAAASVVLDPSALADTVTVWLRASSETEAMNISGSGQHHRPLAGDAAALLRRVGGARNPVYARMADIVIDVGADPSWTCDRVIEALQPRRAR